MVTDEVYWRQDGSAFRFLQCPPIQEQDRIIAWSAPLLISLYAPLEDPLRHARDEGCRVSWCGIAHDFNTSCRSFGQHPDPAV